MASLALFLTLFLPWYQQSVIARSAAAKNLQAASNSITGWGAFSFVEAAVLLVSVGVLALLFQRAEGSAFHLPGGDGWVITLAGVWTCFLVVWRMFDKQGTTNHGQYALTTGIEWGIFVALFVAAFLTYAGTRIRAARAPEPPLPGSEGIVFDGRWHAAGEQPARQQRRPRSRASAAPVRAGGDLRDPPGESPPARPRRGRRSSWSPAERPEWSDSDRPAGWLTAPPASGAQREPGEPAPGDPPAEPPRSGGTDPPPATDQLTIPLEGDE